MTPPRSIPALLLATAVVAVGAGADDGDRRFSDETTVVSVDVPVQVLFKGEPVRDLTDEDFEIFDRGRRQALTGFQVFDLQGLEAASPAATDFSALPRAARRHLLLLFDLSFSNPAMIERARQAGADLVETVLHPTDRVAVGAYSAAGGVEILLSFTPDHEQVLRAFELLGPSQPISHHRDPLALVLGDIFDPGHPYRSGGGGGNNKAERYDTMLQNYRDLESFSARSARDRQQADVHRFLTSLRDLGSLLRDVPGSKQVLLLSEGFDDTVLVGTANAERMAEIADDSMRGELWRVDSEERFGSNAVRRSMELTVEELRRAGCVVQAVDIGGVRTDSVAGAVREGQNGLFLLADATGGELYRNDNDLADSVGRMLRRSSLTYVLSFEPDRIETDGEFHALEVRLAKRRRGVRVVHQPGYYAPRRYRDLRPAERRVNTAGLLIDGRDGGALAVSALAAAVPRPGRSAYVPILLEIAGAGLLAEANGAALPLEVYGYAISSSGAIRAHFAHALALDPEKLEELAGGGLKFWGQFELPADRYVLRFLLRNPATGSSGMRSLELAVLDGERSLSPPLIPEARSGWILTRPSGDLPADTPFPFLLAGRPFVPAVEPRIPAGRTLAVSLLADGVDDDLPPLTGTLLSAGGRYEVPLTVRSATHLAERSRRLEIDAAIPFLAPGAYELAVAFEGALDGPTTIDVVVTAATEEPPPAEEAAVPGVPGR